MSEIGFEKGFEDPASKCESNRLMEVFESDKARYEEYEELLLRRDQLCREAGSYATAYKAEFGDMLTENFKLKVECIKKKKTISYCRRRMNRGLPIDAERMNSEIDNEMKLYYMQLKELIAETKDAKEAGNVGQYRYNRAKKIYRRLAKLIHPDINKLTAENDDLKALWDRIVDAYHHSDIDELNDLEALVYKALEDLGADDFEPDFSNIEERIERVEQQINEILNTEPYIYGELLNDEEKKKEYIEQLKAEHADYEQYLVLLTNALDEMLREGGVKVVWKMN